MKVSWFINWDKLKHTLLERYKLVVLNEGTFEEKASFTGNAANLVALGIAGSILIMLITIILIAITPLKEYFIFSGDGVSRRELSKAYAKSDSLESLVQANTLYLANLQNVMNGKAGQEIIEDKESANQKKTSTTSNGEERSATETALRSLVGSENRSAVSSKGAEPGSKVSPYRFITPVRGIVTNGFDSKNAHYAIDIAARKSEAIKASLNGRVIFSAFTSQTGYVIALQHADNMVTFYKHCSALLKKTGSFVQAGDVIAIVGNTGEYTSGPHLHFELWHKGNAVDPKNYINF